jgi:acyl-coenzyme A thioesterase PaaI-like protein
MSDRTLTDAQEAWRSGVAKLVSYRYLGTYSEPTGHHQAEGSLTIRSDLRGPAGLLAAPLGIAALHTAGVNVDAIAAVSPTRIDLEIFGPALDICRLRVEGRVLREGRSQMFTESRLVDAGETGRLVGFASTHWAVSGPNPNYTRVDPRPGVPESPDLPPLYQAYGATLRDDGNLEIPELPPELNHDGLHQGPIQVVGEAAAMMAAERALGTGVFWIERHGISIVKRGHHPPFVTSSEVLATDQEGATVRAELRDARNQVCSVSFCRFRLS